jgi:hypothetical protein
MTDRGIAGVKKMTEALSGYTITIHDTAASTTVVLSKFKEDDARECAAMDETAKRAATSQMEHAISMQKIATKKHAEGQKLAYEAADRRKESLSNSWGDHPRRYSF